MPRELLLCTLIVAAFRLPLAAAPPISEDVEVPPATLALARTLGMDLARDRARFMSELTRIFYTRSDSRRASDHARAAESPDAVSEGPYRVAVPLTVTIWSQAVFKRAIVASQLVPAILQDRQAALLCRGLSSLDDETLAFFAGRPALLARLYERDAAVFAAFVESFHVREGRVALADDNAAALWEGVVGARLDSPERFLIGLVELGEGRLAYLFHTIANLDPPHRAFALGSWIEDADVRAARFVALAAVAVRSYREWHAPTMPFSRPLNDLATALLRIRVDRSGNPLAPSTVAFWERAFNMSDDVSADANTRVRDAAGRGLLDAAWLADATAPGDLFSRADRLDQFEFGQRLFSDAPETDWPDAFTAIRAFPRQRMLMLTLERIGVRRASIYAAGVRQARLVTGGDPNRTFWTLAQFQACLALVTRMVGNGTMSNAVAEGLVSSLFAVPLTEGRSDGELARWIDSELLSSLPAADSAEDALLAAVAGPANLPGAPRIVWEGQRYRVDFGAAESRRLHLIREKQGGYSAEAILELAREARALRAERPTGEDVRGAIDRLTGLLEVLASNRRPTEVLAPGVQTPRPLREVVARAVDELARMQKSRDFRRAGRVASSILEAADSALAEVLLSIVYALDLGDPEGTALLGSNVALRHDFGFELPDPEARARRPWAVPRQDFLPGIPWHVTGALIGLDVALAPMTLRRINLDAFADAPRVSSNERDAFAVNVALVNHRALRDEDRDRIARAVEQGEARVARLVSSIEPFDSVARALALDGWRRRELAWRITNDPDRAGSFFSLVELGMLGGLELSELDAWGASALYSSVCVCSRMVGPSRWSLISGRPQVAVMASIVPDLNLRIAIVLRDLALPASLARPVLSAAMQDLIDEAAPSDSADWWGLAVAARSLSHQRIEDYIAAAAAVDGPLVPEDDGTAPEP